MAPVFSYRMSYDVFRIYTNRLRQRARKVARDLAARPGPDCSHGISREAQ
ncbi:MAG: hypothetical protein AVDCRST_MAG14-795 [uncultured Rubrobacteraceae bacterium]|uniref:Uncharacterized protein n=1 Tax=uncultured Rubrobacteraceae bacterium TaxID=349277 RepID=A0A6J4QY84_9ACTN|nr:MAG: hypothetical protein AVDCRST_MAG14-795 [uncultured Rubrobacteraceae bacterium]